MEEDNKSNKRARVEYEDCELEANSVPNLKLARVESANTGSNSQVATHVDPDPDDAASQSPEVKRIQEDLLNILDDSDPVIGPDPEIQGLDLVIKSFEEEIMVLGQAPTPVMKSDSVEFRTELGFLLEASEEELNLPPIFSCVDEEQKIETVDVEGSGRPGAVGFAEMVGYEFPIPSYESFEFGMDGDPDVTICDSKSGEFVALGGLFDTSADISELTWRPESLSAL